MAHTRHYAFGIALPILIAATTYLQTQATPSELSSAQGMAAQFTDLIGVIATLAAGFIDMYKARNSGGTDPTPVTQMIVQGGNGQQGQQQQTTTAGTVSIENSEFTSIELQKIQAAANPDELGKVIPTTDPRFGDAYKLWVSSHGFKPAAAVGA